MASCNGTKSSWPELVGIDGDAAVQIITSQEPGIRAAKVSQGFGVTSDFRCDRVRVFVDANDTVATVPKIG